MAAYFVTTEAEEALAAATAETLIQLRGVTTTRAKLIAWGVSFDGVTAAAAPVEVRLVRQSTDGTASAASEIKADESAPAALLTAFHSFTAEPTTTDVFEHHEIHPQGGNLIREYRPGTEPIVNNLTTSRLAIIATAPAIVNVVAWMQWEE